MQDVYADLHDKKEFKTNSITAFKFGFIYEVLSYTKVIFRYDLLTNKVTYFDNTKYSKTTSRLQNMLKELYRKEINDLQELN